MEIIENFHVFNLTFKFNCNVYFQCTVDFDLKVLLIKSVSFYEFLFVKYVGVI